MSATAVKPSASASVIPSGRSRYMKLRSACSPNGSNAICTPGGYHRDRIGRFGRWKCGAAPTAVKMLVARARCSISCLMTSISVASHACTRASGAFERELRVQVLTHQAMLDLAGLAEQVDKLLTALDLQRRLGSHRGP